MVSALCRRQLFSVVLQYQDIHGNNIKLSEQAPELKKETNQFINGHRNQYMQALPLNLANAASAVGF
jgi:hypothetical protein